MLKPSNSINSLKKKQENHEKFLASQKNLISPQPDKKNIVVLKGVRRVASSATAALGNVDAYGLGLEEKEWIRANSTSENAEDAFWTKKAPSKKNRMWNDPSIPDYLFAADQEIDPKFLRENPGKIKHAGM